MFRDFFGGREEGGSCVWDFSMGESWAEVSTGFLIGERRDGVRFWFFDGRGS